MNINCITLLNLFCRLADRPVVPLEAIAPLPLQELHRSCLRSHNDKGKLYSVLSLPTGHSMCNCSLFVAFDVPIWCNILYLGAPLSLLISIACNNAPTFTSTQLLFGNQRQTVGMRFSTHSNFRLFKSSVRPHFRGYSPYTASLHNHRQPTPL